MTISEKERRLMIAEEKLQKAKKEMDLFLTKQLANTCNTSNNAKEDIKLQKQLEEAKTEYKKAKADIEAYSDEEIDCIALGIVNEEKLTEDEENIINNIANLL